MSKSKQEDYNPDPALEEGPIENRGCTDIICCLIFIASWVAIVIVAAYAFANGNPKVLMYPMDSSNNSCGYTSGFENYTYLFYPVPFPGYLNITVCLSECPIGNETVLSCKTNTAVTTCTVSNLLTSSFDYTTMSSATLKTSVFTYNTTGFVNRFCLPVEQFYAYLSTLSNGLISSGSDRVTQWISDLQTTWTIILATLGIAFILGLIWMVLMRCCAGVLTWLSIILFLAAIAALGAVLYKKAIEKEDQLNSNGIDSSSGDSTEVDTIKGLKALGIICWVLDGIFLIIILCIFKSIRLAIAIVKAAADFVRDTPSSLIVPLILVIVLGLYYAFWIAVALFLYSIGEPYSSGASPIASIKWNNNTKRLLVYWLFELLWNNAFFVAVGYFILASAACLWYFSQGTESGPHRVVSRSFYRAFRYHLGSLAFGSFILAVIQLIQVILAFIQKQVEKYGGKENKCLRIIIGCLQCYVACFERFIKFLNKNAYIQIALTGKNFCSAAKDGLLLAMSNPIRFGLVSGLGDMFMFFGKLFIMIVSTLIGYLIITRSNYYSSRLYSPIFPCFAFLIVAYFVAELFMMVYGMAANAILQCFCLDEEMQKKKNCPARHCPETLKTFIETHRKQKKSN